MDGDAMNVSLEMLDNFETQRLRLEGMTDDEIMAEIRELLELSEAEKISKELGND